MKRERHLIMKCFQRCLLSPAFVCVRAHIVCQCRTECISYSLCLYLSVFACPSVCGGWWQHTRCPLSRGSTVNISKQRTCWRALTLSTPLNSIHPSIPPSPCMHVCSTSVSPLQGNSNIHLPSFVKGRVGWIFMQRRGNVCVWVYLVFPTLWGPNVPTRNTSNSNTIFCPIVTPVN